MFKNLYKRCRAVVAEDLPGLRLYANKVKRNIKRHRRILVRVGCALSAVFIVAYIVYHITFSAPYGAPAPIIVRVAKSQTLGEISNQFQEAHLVRHALVMRTMVRIIGCDHRVQSGAYFFDEPQSVFKIVLRLVFGEHNLAPVRVIVHENETIREISDMLALKLAPFDSAEFLSAAAPHEGCLYPDTYYFFPAQDAKDVEDSMEQNFYRKLEQAQSAIHASKNKLADIITMASIVAGEALTENDRHAVAGILWKRISIGMFLQVDAPFGYVLDKSLTELTRADLAKDTPYNTYKHKGLPPTPIGSPSISAIIAAAESTSTPFLYYLSDGTGTMHYSVTYGQHKAQIQKYL